MTETSCVITTMDSDDRLIGHVGSPNPSCGKICVWIFKDVVGFAWIKTCLFVHSNSSLLWCDTVEL